jgi:hypothetical protein
MLKQSYENWCSEVVSALESVDRVRGRKPGESAQAMLERCRGDEALGAYDSGESALEYAAYLSTPNERDGDTGYLEEVEL